MLRYCRRGVVDYSDQEDSKSYQTQSDEMAVHRVDMWRQDSVLFTSLMSYAFLKGQDGSVGCNR